MALRKERLLGLYVLLVDDHLDTLEVFGSYILSYGADVRGAANGPAALADLAIARPNVIVVDYAMPGMTGFDFMERARKLPGYEGRPVPAILCSAESGLGDAAKTAGFSSYMTKPIDPQALVEEIARLADKSP